MSSQWRDQWTTGYSSAFKVVVKPPPDRAALQASFAALGMARVVAGARALYLRPAGWMTCFLALAYGDAGELSRAIAEGLPDEAEASDDQLTVDHYFGGVEGLIGIEGEHIATIVGYFDSDRAGFMDELRRWLQSRGVSVTTVLALAQRDAEAQQLPRAATRFRSGHGI